MTPFGAYVHIPFCAHRCDYCAFATWTDRGHLVSRYLAAVGREVDAANAEGLPSLTSVFFFQLDAVLEILGVPKEDGWLFSSCVTFGYPTGKWGVAPRRPRGGKPGRGEADFRDTPMIRHSGARAKRANPESRAVSGFRVHAKARVPE